MLPELDCKSSLKYKSVYIMFNEKLLLQCAANMHLHAFVQAVRSTKTKNFYKQRMLNCWINMKKKTLQAVWP